MNHPDDGNHHSHSYHHGNYGNHFGNHNVKHGKKCKKWRGEGGMKGIRGDKKWRKDIPS